MTETAMLDRRLQALTTLLHSIQSSNRVVSSSQTLDLSMYSHLATLLSLGSETTKVVAVTGAFFHNVNKDTVGQTRFKKGDLCVIVLTDEKGSGESCSLDAPVQDTGMSLDALTPDERWTILGDDKITLEQLRELGMSSQRPLRSHGQRVLAALKATVKLFSAREQGNQDPHLPLFNLILHSCCAKILARLKMDKRAVFQGQRSFADILINWEPLEEEDPLGARTLGVNGADVEVLRNIWDVREGAAFAHQLKNNRGEYVMTQENAIFWVRTAGHTINVVIEKFQQYNTLRRHMEDQQDHECVANVSSIRGPISLFYRLVHRSDRFFSRLLGIWSLREVVLSNLQTWGNDDGFAVYTKDGSSSASPQGPLNKDAEADFEKDEDIHTFRNDSDLTTAPVLRYLEYSLAWVTAVYNLPHAEAVRKLDIKASIVTTKLSGNATFDRSSLSATLVETRQNISPNVLQIIMGDISEHVPSIHAEASLIGLLEVASAHTSTPASRLLKSEKVIGVPRKCCYCCDWVAAKLHYQLPNTHGVVYPWAAPRCQGLSTEILNQLADHLRAKLFQAVGFMELDLDASFWSTPISDWA